MTNFDEATHPGWNDWRRHSTVTMGQAVCLLSRVHPIAYEGKGYDDLPVDAKSKGYVIKHAIQQGELSPKELYVVRDGRVEPIAARLLLPHEQIAYETVFTRDSFARWCDEHGDLHPWAASQRSPTHVPEDKPLTSRERTSLLAIIRALSVMTKANGRGATSAIEAQLHELGFDSPKEATIRTLLREASELQP